ncbi:MAG: hypothetical protein KF729_26105 [Sandaracinaceae bacterium]|nr:hypothetical protein [Sandaracinaceae bacterium]
MHFEITDPCEEPWDSMEPRDGGRYCGRCDKVVVDLSVLSRAQAEAKIGALDADEVCVRLAVDRFGDAVFQRPPPSRAPHWAAGLVLVSALSASGCAVEEPAPCLAKHAPITPDPGPPMMPAAVVAVAEPQPVSGAVPADQLADAGDARPTSEQRALTEAKHRPPSHHIHMVAGRMPLPPRQPTFF